MFSFIVRSFCLLAVLFSCNISCSAIKLSDDNYAVINGKKIYLEIADTREKRLKGLMYIKKLPENAGMIFIFSEPEPRSFWMRNVEIPLDIIFIKNKKIINIHENIPVDKENKNLIYKSAYRADSVIEVNGGFCQEYNVKTGNTVILSDDVNYIWGKLRSSGNEQQ